MLNDMLTAEMLGTNQSRIKKLKERLGIKTIRDFLEYYPRRYEDMSAFAPLSEFRVDMVKVAVGTLGAIESSRIRGGRTIQKTLFTDEEGTTLPVSWFNQEHLRRMYHIGDKVLLAGKIKFVGGKKTLNSPQIEKYSEKSLHLGKIISVYGATEGLSAKWLREKIALLKKYISKIEEFLPEDILTGERLLPRATAIKEIHFPTNHETLEHARRRLAFEEVFIFQCIAVMDRNRFRMGQSPVIEIDKDILHDYVSAQKFTPTNAQKVALYEILKDMENPVSMQRLLQGDVGSGKTFVAVASAVNVIAQGYQVAFLAPTEVLARQHYTKIKDTKNISVALLLGSTSAKEKKEIKESLKNGEIDLIIGTHALMTEDTEFANLGLAIIDEQHRFGVEQRKILSQKGSPHVLALSATPIPRSLAMAMYGNTQVSIIDEMPEGRKPIETYVVPPYKQTDGLRFVEKEIEKGHQAYFVYPLISESESEKMKLVRSAEEQLKTLSDFYPERKLALLHGKMKTEKKQEIMEKFSSGEIDILVSTAVIEVGVDVPNASIIVIESAERFGLAQLHQFRGRVGRGDAQSYCLLFTSEESHTDVERLQALSRTTSGFELAEIDLKLRGPGDFFGTSQSGYLDFKMGNMMDARLISACRGYAEDVLSKDAQLGNYPLLKQKIIDKIVEKNS